MAPQLFRIRTRFLGLSALNRKRILVAAVLAFLVILGCVVLRNVPKPWEGRAPKYLEAVREGHRKGLPTEYFAQVYLWKAGVVNVGLLGFLLVTSPVWVRWLDGAESERVGRRVEGGRVSGRSWLAFGLAMTVFLALRLPMMERPLLFDEQDNLRRSFHGYVDVTEGGETWVGVSWLDTFFENRYGNNPALYGVAARLSMDSWRAMTGGAPDTFSLWMMRLPSLLSGVLLMLLVWRFIHSLGSPAAAVIAVFLIGLHPLAIDYHTQARGYGFVMLFATLASACAYQAVQQHGWRPWIGYGASQVAMLWSNEGSVYFALALNSLLGAHLVVARWRRGDEGASLARFALVTLVSGMLFLQVMLPVMVQAKTYLESRFERSHLDASWAFTIVSGYGSGHSLPPADWWHGSDPAERDIAAFFTQHYLPEHPLGAALALGFLPLLVGTAVVRLARRDHMALLVLGAGLVAPVLAFLHQRLFAGLWLYYWYLIYLLPFLCILAALGLATIGSGRRAVAPAGIVAFLVFFALAVETPWPMPPGAQYRASPDVVEIERPGYLYRVAKAGRMTRKPRREASGAAAKSATQSTVVVGVGGPSQSFP